MARSEVLLNVFKIKTDSGISIQQIRQSISKRNPKVPVILLM